MKSKKKKVPNVVANKPKQVNPEQILKERIKAKLKAKGLKPPIQSKIKPKPFFSRQESPKKGVSKLDEILLEIPVGKFMSDKRTLRQAPGADVAYEDVCQEMAVESDDKHFQDENAKLIAEKELGGSLKDIYNSFRLNLGSDPDKFIALLRGQGYAPKIPGEPDRITAGRPLFVPMPKVEEKLPEKSAIADTADQPITISISASALSKLRGLGISIT